MAKHTAALLTVEDLSSIYSLVDLEDKNEPAEGSDWIQWAHDSHDDDENIAYLAFNEGTEIKQVFFLNASLQSCDIQPTDKKAQHDGRRQSGIQQESLFDVLKIGTYANQTSVIGFEQYHAYCRTLYFLQLMKPTANRSISRAGGRNKPVGAVVMQVPFKELKIVIFVTIIVLKEDIPGLLSMKDMIDNGLDIFIQGHHASLAQRRHVLSTEDYFLIHRWKSADTDFVVYTVKQLRTPYPNLGYSSVKVLESLLWWADRYTFDTTTVKFPEKLQKD